MKLRNLKTWLPGMILGLSLLAAVPVSAGNLRSKNTPPEYKIEQLSSTNNSGEDSQSRDASGNVYDFKDSKTSGVVVVTKTWEDNLSNEERPVPDVSISTKFPNKSTLGYTVTFHGNGFTFPDGSTENEIIVNNSGEVVSGQYKVPGNEEFGCWSSTPDSTTKVEVSEKGVPLNGSFDMDLYARKKTYVLKTGPEFNEIITPYWRNIRYIYFTSRVMPDSVDKIDVDADGDEGIVAWIDGYSLYISSQSNGQKVVASSDCRKMFYDLPYLFNVYFDNLDTSNVVDFGNGRSGSSGSYGGMFTDCKNLSSLDLSTLDLSNATYMAGMFSGCKSLNYIKLTGLNVEKVENMSSLFSDCSSLTELDLSSFETPNLQYTDYMFKGCTSLQIINLSSLDMRNITPDTGGYANTYEMFEDTALEKLTIGKNFRFVGDNYCLPSGTWTNSSGESYTSDGTTCDIPNGIADTYTRE